MQLFVYYPDLTATHSTRQSDSNTRHCPSQEKSSKTMIQRITHGKISRIGKNSFRTPSSMQIRLLPHLTPTRITMTSSFPDDTFTTATLLWGKSTRSNKNPDIHGRRTFETKVPLMNQIEIVTRTTKFIKREL